MAFFFCRVAASSNKVIELTTIPVKIIAGDVESLATKVNACTS